MEGQCQRGAVGGGRASGLCLTPGFSLPQLFITVMDKLRLEIRAMDEVKEGFGCDAHVLGTGRWCLPHVPHSSDKEGYQGLPQSCGHLGTCSGLSPAAWKLPSLDTSLPGRGDAPQGCCVCRCWGEGVGRLAGSTAPVADWAGNAALGRARQAGSPTSGLSSLKGMLWPIES